MTDPIVDFSGARRRGAAAQEREVRSEETDIRQGGASADSSAASAESTRATTPVNIARTQSQTATEEATRPAVVRRAEAEAEGAELRNQQLRAAMERSRRGGAERPQGDVLARAELEARTMVGNLLQARRLSRDQFSASGFGYNALTTNMAGQDRAGGGWSGSPAATVSGLLLPAQSFVALNEVMNLREESPTGAGLGGNTSDRDMSTLMSSYGELNPNLNDSAFQGQIDNVLAYALNEYNTIGGDPYAMADLFAPDEIEQYAPLLRGWRGLPEDDEAFLSYVNNSRADGTFDPVDYAALSAERYFRATGRQPDEAFVSAALDNAYELQGSTAPVASLNYEAADEQTRRRAIERVKAQEPTETSWGEAVGDFSLNLVPSIGEYAADTAHALTLGLPETIPAVVNTAAGAAQALVNNASNSVGGPNLLPSGGAPAETWGAVRDRYATDWGTGEGFRRAISTNPAGMLADVAGVATLGSTGLVNGLRVAGTGSRLANAADNVANMAARLDPLRLATDVGVPLTRTLVNGATNVATVLPARAAGTTGAALRRAVDSGRRGSAEFLEHIDGGDLDAPIQQVRDALGEIRDTRNANYANYTNEMGIVEHVPFDAVLGAIDDVRSFGVSARGRNTTGGELVWPRINEIVRTYADNGWNTLADFDAMKREIGVVGRDVGTAEGSATSRAVASNVYNAIGNTIRQHAPIYGEMMEDYAAMSRTINDIEASLGLAAPSPDTILSKLQRRVEGRGPRGDMIINLLENTNAGRGLGDRLAGLAFQSTEAPSINTLAGTTGSAVSGSIVPAIASAATTPHGIGMRAYNVGEGIGTAQQWGRNVRETAPINFIERMMAEYDTPARRTTARRGLTVANPTAIQPLYVDPAVPDEAMTEEERLLIRQARPVFPSGTTPYTTLGNGSLEELSARYGTPDAATPAVDMGALRERYDVPAATTPADAPLLVNGRRVQYDRMTDEYVDLDTGDRVRDVQEFSTPAYRRGGRVRGR